MNVVLIAHNVRSAHNVGSLIRTAEGVGVQRLYLTGYTPYPLAADDQRLPHLAMKIDKQIKKTALGAERSLAIKHDPDVFGVIDELKALGLQIVALEQTASAIALNHFKPQKDVALIVGNEVKGLEGEVLEVCALALHIPMQGQKESFNVTQACAMALYQLRFGA